MAPTRAATPWRETRSRVGQDPLIALLKQCEGSLGWIAPTPKPPKPVDDADLDFSACDGDPVRKDLVRADAQRRAENLARHKVYVVEAAKLRRKMAERPRLLTVANLQLSLQYCWRKRISILTPIALTFHVEDALRLANQPEKPVDIMQQRREAIEWEQHHDDEQSELWLRRLSRSQGAGLVDTLDKWKAARRR